MQYLRGFKTPRRWPLRALIAVLALSELPPSFALPNDRMQPITIDADTAEHDEQAGTITYAGAVIMQQGSMRIDADKVVIHSAKDRVTKIVAKGQPASYQQQPQAAGEQVVAKAKQIEYNLEQDSLKLTDNASLQQGGTRLSGTTIEYDVRKAVVKADSEGRTNERVRMVIPPKALHQTGEAVEASSSLSEQAP